MKKPRTIHAAPYRRGGELFRVIFTQDDEDKKVLWRYEVWATREAIQDKLQISHYPSAKELLEFANVIYKNRMDEVNFKPTSNEGAFVISNDQIVYADYHTFPGSVIQDADNYQQTNISLPKTLHEWLKIEAVKNNDSLSETIRKAITFYKDKTFVCNKCGRTIHGEPEINNDCYACFLKSFEESS